LVQLLGAGHGTLPFDGLAKLVIGENRISTLLSKSTLKPDEPKIMNSDFFIF
jgi:hypothetical protein